MASIKPRISRRIGTIAKINTNSGVFFTGESSGRTDTQILPKTAANAAATGRITNFPVSIIASSARAVAEKNSSNKPAMITGAEARLMY